MLIIKLGTNLLKIATEIKGTCFDIIAIRNATCICIEAKHIQGDKLYFKGSGLWKKQDELNHFVKHCNTNVYIFVKSDKTGTWYIPWLKAYPIFEKVGYVKKEDCIPVRIGDDL